MVNRYFRVRRVAVDALATRLGGEHSPWGRTCAEMRCTRPQHTEMVQLRGSRYRERVRSRCQARVTDVIESSRAVTDTVAIAMLWSATP